MRKASKETNWKSILEKGMAIFKNIHIKKVNSARYMKWTHLSWKICLEHVYAYKYKGLKDIRHTFTQML